MSALARRWARILWYAMLWLMRRDWMKRLQRAAIKLAPETRREKIRLNVVQQNIFARKIGLPLMTFMMNLVIISLLITFVWWASLWMIENGILGVPDSVREAAGRQ